MKNYRLALLVAFLALPLVACGDDSDSAADGGADAGNHDHDKDKDATTPDIKDAGGGTDACTGCSDGAVDDIDSGNDDDAGGGGGGGGDIVDEATATGTIDGDAITATNAGTVFDDSKSDSREVMLVVASAAPLCPVLLETAGPGDAYAFVFDIKIVGQHSKWDKTKGAFTLETGAKTAAGAIIGMDKVVYNKFVNDATVVEEEATEASVTITDAVDGEALAGTFSLTFPSGSVSGTFGAPECK